MVARGNAEGGRLAPPTPRHAELKVKENQKKNKRKRRKKKTETN
jgi:hypothetical protein